MSRAAAPSSQRRDAGTSLLELVVVLAIFASVALMGMQGLRMMLRYQEQLAQASAQTSQMQRAVSLLRHDFAAALDLSDSTAARTEETALLLTGVPRLDDPSQTETIEVLWRFDVAQQQVLRRRLSEPEQAKGSLVLDGVSQFEIAVLTEDGWIAPRRLKPDDPPPRAYEARLSTARGPLRILVVK